MKPEILFVDDEEQIRSLLAEYFGRKGYATRTAATATEAQQALADQMPSLVVLDVELRESDGFALLESIRAKHASLPIMMLTGKGVDLELLNMALEKGANGYMSKGLPLDQLLAQVQLLLKTSGSVI